MTSGFRTFTAGEVLTASNVQNYLMDQSVMTFAGSAARSSAIGTANFEEGMTSYLKDTDKLEVYNGTNWVGVAPTTTQGLTLINTTSFSAVASQSVNDVFSATYDNYKIIFALTGCTGDASVFIKLRVSGADSSANYNFIVPSYDTGASASFGNAAGDTVMFLYRVDAGNNNASYLADLTLSNPFATQFTNFVGVGVGRKSTGTTEGASIQGTHTLANSYTGFTLLTGVGNFSGTVSTYGFSK